ncbi:hypothetical protein OPKNFCMD_0679 [Methylobacterium crusticola]|uniref:Uncharacterized protein n=1 Tax=Methylobacterium crusticola TaxID=1697972 RepID=A0ABQ4QSC7_9HYPH|nr:hypothetical protein [Methylobacterium crusticola]GJD47966.1 hypothetical protein OPKNFCMD_0679 [Methylobacterium crusticola]
MKTLTLTLAATVMLGCLGFAAAPASAAVTGPSAVATDGSTVERAAMQGRHRMMRHQRMMRHRGVHRRMMRSDPNSRNPSRPGYQQQKGNTSGGPAY